MTATLEHPLTRKSCIFCIEDPAIGTGDGGIEPGRILKRYNAWWLILHREEKRTEMGRVAAGFFVARRAVALIGQLPAEDFGEIVTIVHDAARTLCIAVRSTYTNQYTVGLNEGIEAGQNIAHAHVHIFPVCQQDPKELKVRAGIGGAFAALRNERLSKSEKV